MMQVDSRQGYRHEIERLEKWIKNTEALLVATKRRVETLKKELEKEGEFLELFPGDRWHEVLAYRRRGFKLSEIVRWFNQ